MNNDRSTTDDEQQPTNDGQEATNDDRRLMDVERQPTNDGRRANHDERRMMIDRRKTTKNVTTPTECVVSFSPRPPVINDD